MIYFKAESEDPDEYPIMYCANEHQAMDFANRMRPGLTWYQIHDNWWRGVNGFTGHAWSVTRYTTD